MKYILMLLLMSTPAFSGEGLNHNHVIQEATVKDRLLISGWDLQAAVVVTELNQEVFSILRDENKEGFERAIQRLEILGDYPALMLMLQRHPELAGLLAKADHPRDVADSFNNEECYGGIGGFYQFIIDPAEQNALAASLNRHGSVICRLSARGIPAPFTMFVFDHRQPGTEEYARWLDGALKYALSLSGPNADERLAETVGFIASKGKEIRGRMANDKMFKKRFSSDLWPAFLRVTDCSHKSEGDCDTAFEILSDEPLVWDLLLQDQGERLLGLRGPLSVMMLVDDYDFPPVLRVLATKAIIDENDGMIGSLLRYKDEPLFRDAMLRRDLTPDLLDRVLADLHKNCPNQSEPCAALNELLKDYALLSPSALKEELAPLPDGFVTWVPFYSTYYLAKKLAQGRNIDPEDMAFAALDAISVVFIVRGGSIVAQKIVRNSSKSLAKTAVEKGARKASEKLGPGGLKIVGAMLPKGKAAASAKQYYRPFIKASKSIDETGRRVRNLTHIDITESLKWAFNKSGVGRESVKKWTGLEARVFMRGDAQVIVDPKKGLLGGFLREIAENMIADTSMETAEILWQKHASAWWLAQAAVP